jgi:hypothetical protein
MSHRTSKLDFVFVADFPRRVLDDFSSTLADYGLDQRTLLNVTAAAIAQG